MKINADFAWKGQETITLAPHKETSSKSASKLCTVLVIEDDLTQQRLIHQTLAPHAEVIQELDTDGDRVKNLELDGIDAIILDYMLPGEDGLSILTRIRERNLDIPVLFMTGFGNLDLARKAIAAGANEYFPKPFDPLDLQRVMEKWVTNFNSQNGHRAVTPSLEADRSLATNIAEEENYLTAINITGEEILARVIRYNSRAVVVETEPDIDLSVGAHLKNTHVTIGHRSVEIIGAEVRKITRLAERCWVEISLPGVWQIEGFKQDTDSETVSQIVRERQKPTELDSGRLELGVRERQTIPESLRTAIFDFVAILEELNDDLRPFEGLMQEVESDERSKIEEKIIGYSETRFFPMLNRSMAEFEKAANGAIELGIADEFKTLAQKKLYPLILCSPFVSRVIHQPIGVPGDFGILGHLIGHPYQGHDLYSRILNAWFIETGASSAYQYRIALLEDAIQDTVDQNDQNETASVLSMASGVAYEVQRFLLKSGQENKVDFELVDFSNRTLLEAKKHFSRCQKAVDPNGIDLTLRQGSVIDLAKNAKGHTQSAPLSEQYDLVYCAGLFDYLSSRMCARIVSYLYGLTKPGGKLIVSNFTPLNATRNFMDMVFEWELIYRSVEEFEVVMSNTDARDNFKIIEDDTRTELYAIAEKPL